LAKTNVKTDSPRKEKKKKPSALRESMLQVTKTHQRPAGKKK